MRSTPSDSRTGRRHCAPPGDRDRHRQHVGSAGAGHRAHRFGRADAPGDIGIADGFADRYRPQRLPDPLLKRGAANIQRQRQPVLRRFNQPHHLRHQRFILRVAADQLGIRELVLQILHQPLRIVPSRMAQMPTSLCAAGISPSEQRPTAKWMRMPLPPAR